MVDKWGIYFVNLNPTQGSEQKGQRPILVVSNDAVNKNLPICTIIPFSSYKENDKVYPTELIVSKKDSGLSKDGILMIQQIRTIDQSRALGLKVGEIKGEVIKNEINIKIKDYFDL
ncbi:MAG: type II toxin-antitoxin system PemK/MazF family toxin [Bacilli bacterium]|nr:type II toxin-antitoxin system PemK/MazF family toxin [Bacilli bacterium]